MITTSAAIAINAATRFQPLVWYVQGNKRLLYVETLLQLHFRNTLQVV